VSLPPFVSAVIAVLLAAAIGAIPTGYLVARRLRGVDIRRLSPHNLGLSTVVAAVGIPTLLAAGLLDLPGAIVDETSTNQPTSLYGRSKLLAERVDVTREMRADA